MLFGSGGVVVGAGLSDVRPLILGLTSRVIFSMTNVSTIGEKVC